MTFAKRWIAPALVAVVLAILAWFGLNGGQHLLYDHRSLHEVIRFLNSGQQAPPVESSESPAEAAAEEPTEEPG